MRLVIFAVVALGAAAGACGPEDDLIQDEPCCEEKASEETCHRFLGCVWTGPGSAEQCVKRPPPPPLAPVLAAPDAFEGGEAFTEGGDAFAGGDGPSCASKKGRDSKSWHRKDAPTKTCAWVEREPSRRCRKKDATGARAETECVRACASCPSGGACVDDATWSHTNKKNKEITCAKVARNAGRRCALPGAAAACERTCGGCSGDAGAVVGATTTTVAFAGAAECENDETWKTPQGVGCGSHHKKKCKKQTGCKWKRKRCNDDKAKSCSDLFKKYDKKKTQGKMKEKDEKKVGKLCDKKKDAAKIKASAACRESCGTCPAESPPETASPTPTPAPTATTPAPTASDASTGAHLWEQPTDYDSSTNPIGVVADPDFSLTAEFRFETTITPGDAAIAGIIAGRGRSGVPQGWLLLITPSRHVLLYLYGATGYEHAAGLTPSCVEDVVDFGGLWGGELTSRTALPVGEETTLVLLRAGNTFELYVDGDLSCAADVTSWSDTATHVPHAVGAYYAPGTGGPTELPFDGKITATKFTEVSANDGTAPTPAPTVTPMVTPAPTPAPTSPAATPAPALAPTPSKLAADEWCETSSQCQASLFCNGDPKCEACYYPGDLEKDEAGCARYVEACCEHGLSGDAALCVCAGSDGNSSGGASTVEP